MANFSLNRKINTSILWYVILITILFWFVVSYLFNAFSLRSFINDSLPWITAEATSEDLGVSKVYIKDDLSIDGPSDKLILINNFGDNFSGDAYLNMAATDMYFDQLVTALTFEPVYAFKKIRDCGSESCGIEPDLLVTGDTTKACFGTKCLIASGTSLFLNEARINLPQTLSDKKVRSLTVGKLKSKWLIGVVTGKSSDEFGFVYSFDGKTFTPIITDTTNNQIKPRYNRSGGKIGFGGTDDDFLIIYGGYDGIAYRMYKGKIVDISEFFGLRVTDQGFYPQVIKAGDGKDSIWYICSFTDNKPKFIKLWQNGTANIKGGMDLSGELFVNELYGQNMRCALADKDRAEVSLTIGNGYKQLWKFQDYGFDNSHYYLAVSKDIMNKDNLKVVNAMIEKMGVSLNFNDNSSVYNLDLGSMARLSLSNDGEIWHTTSLYKKVVFPEYTDQLYWRFDFKPSDDNAYSPWLDHINNLSYGLINEN